MQSIIHLLKEKSNLTNNEGILAQALLTYHGDLRKLKIREIVEIAHVSNASATRLAQSIGLNGFNELCYSLANELETIANQPKLYYNDTIESYIVAHNNALVNTSKQFDYQQIVNIAKDIAGSDQVILFSMGTSQLKALDFEYKLRKIGIKTAASFDSHQQELQAKIASQDTVALAISYSGLTNEIIKCTDIAVQSTAKCYAITSNGELLNPMVNVIQIAASENQTRLFSITAVSTISFVLDLIFFEIIKINSEKYESMLNLVQKQK